MAEKPDVDKTLLQWLMLAIKPGPLHNKARDEVSRLIRPHVRKAVGRWFWRVDGRRFRDDLDDYVQAAYIATFRAVLIRFEERVFGDDDREASDVARPAYIRGIAKKAAKQHRRDMGETRKQKELFDYRNVEADELAWLAGDGDIRDTFPPPPAGRKFQRLGHALGLSGRRLGYWNCGVEVAIEMDASLLSWIWFGGGDDTDEASHRQRTVELASERLGVKKATVNSEISRMLKDIRKRHTVDDLWKLMRNDDEEKLRRLGRCLGYTDQRLLYWYSAIRAAIDLDVPGLAWIYPEDDAEAEKLLVAHRGRAVELARKRLAVDHEAAELELRVMLAEIRQEFENGEELKRHMDTQTGCEDDDECGQ